MDTLNQLEQSLQRELPNCIWHCQPSEDAKTVSASGIPSEIEITAILSGKPVSGSPFHVSGNVLTQWGVDATARFICRGFPLVRDPGGSRSSPSWDKLAEL